MAVEGMVILVTGGTSGIGEGVVRHLAGQGAKVICASNQQADGEALERELRDAGGDVRFVSVDIADEASVQRTVTAAAEAYGGLDAVHCNAGVWAQGKITDFDDAIWNKVMGVNVRGTFLTAKHAIPVLEQRRERAGRMGVLLITTSVAVHVGFPQHAVYCASKAALDATIRCLATDHAGKVRVVGISPGTIDTPMLAATCAGWDKPVEELFAEVAEKIPVRRLGQPADIAKAAAFLLSDDADYINGTTLTLDGGTLGLPPW